jgi:hypothetical protein
VTRYALEYERVRSQVNTSPAHQCAAATAPSRGIGLALLLRDGLPAWLQAVRQVLSQAAASAVDHAGAAPLPSPRAAPALPAAGADGSGAPNASSALLEIGRQRDLTTLLASLVLSAMRTADAAPIKEPSPCH